MSDSSENPDTPKNASLDNPRLQIPRPVFQRETTAVDPSEWQPYTPKTSHGFIAMHTSTPEDMHKNRVNGKPTPAKDYFSVPRQKHDPILSPNPAAYEPHGFLPLCSVAAVEVDSTDYFGLSDRTVQSDIRGAGCAAPGMAKDVKCDRAPQFEDHVHASRHSLGEPAHSLESHYRELNTTSQPGAEQDTGRKPEMTLRGGSGEELCDGDKETANRSPTGDVPGPEDEADPPLTSSPIDKAQKDHTEERNRISALNRALEQMLREVAIVCNLALEMNMANNAPASAEDTLGNTAGRDHPKTTSQPPTDRSDVSESSHAA